MTIKISKYHFILLLLVFFHGVINWIILREDNVPFCYDEGGIYEMSRIYYHHLIENFTWNPRKIYHYYWATTYFYPPLYMLSHLPLFLLFGKSQDVAAMTNMIFLSLLIFSVYGIGKRIKDEQTGLFASIILSTFPAIFGFSRTNFVVIALTSLVTFSIYLLLKTENFTNRKYVALFGISIGLGILTKLTYPIYIIAPLLTYVLADIKRTAKRQIGNLFFSLGIGLFITSTWLAPNLITGSFFQEKQLLLGDLWDRPFTSMDLTFYLRKLHIQLGPIYTFLLVVSFILLIYLKIKQKYLYLSWFLFPLIFLSSLYYTQGRYIIPILPAGSLIISSVILKIKRPNMKKLVCFCLIIFGLGQFFLLTFNVNLTDQFTDEEYYHRRRECGMLSASTVDWPVKEIINLFSDYNLVYKENPKPARIIVIATGPLISYLSYTVRLPAEIGGINDTPLNFIFCLLYPSIKRKERIDNADYILIDNQASPLEKREYFEYLDSLLNEFKIREDDYQILTTLFIEKRQDRRLEVYINKKTAEAIKQKKKELVPPAKFLCF